MKCAETGIYGVTIKDGLFEKLIENDPHTLKSVEQFAADWNPSILLYLLHNMKETEDLDNLLQSIFENNSLILAALSSP